MSDPRYFIAQLPPNPFDELEWVSDLPGAEHVHVTRHPDGTITAVPMKRVIDLVLGELPEADWFWVDCPTGGDQ